MIFTDWVIVVILMFNMMIGLTRGFIRMAFDLAALGLSIFAAHRFYEPVSQWLHTVVPFNDVALNVVSVLLIWGGVYGVVIGVGMALNQIASFAAMGPLNRLAGLGLGVLRGALIAAPVVMIWQFIDPSVMQKSVILASVFGRFS